VDDVDSLMHDESITASAQAGAATINAEDQRRTGIGMRQQSPEADSYFIRIVFSG
jgi:hypothetical protein